ncbi:MAG: hypothetical protein GY867_11390 [bacterium]|nr:hypothetical protein [bacterium]
MTYVAGGAGAGAAAAAAAIAQAIKASGAIVKVERNEMTKILNRQNSPLVVTAQKGLFTKKNQYLTSYKGLFFYCESEDRLQTPSGTEFVASKKIWIP